MILDAERENIWGYAKRLRFVRDSITEAFPGRAACTLRVLDVGCGNGSYLALPLARSGFHVVGVDIHEPSIRHAQELAEGRPNARFVCGHIDELQEQPFDSVILSEVMEHVPAPHDLLAAGLRHLSARGIAIVTVPNGFGEFEIDFWLFRNLGLKRLVSSLRHKSRERFTGPLRQDCGESFGATDNRESGHVQFFTRHRLQCLFRDLSLTVFREAGSSFLSGPLATYTLGRFQGFVDWNARIVDKLPLGLASGWFFALRRDPESLGR